MKRRRQSIHASLDSLLDTMTNVVGILVIILVVTILSVQEAVSRISEQLVDKDEVTQEQYDQAVEQANQAAARLVQVRSEPKPQADLTRQRDRLARLNKTLSELKPNQTTSSDTIPDPAALTKQLQAKQKTLQTLQKQVSTVKRQSDELAKQLAAIGQPIKAKPKQVTIPNPRTAPKDAKPVFFLCKGGRVIEVPIERMTDLAEQRLKVVRRSSKSDRPPCKQVVAYLNQNQVQTRDFKLRVRVNSNRLILGFLLQDGAGETVEEIQRSSSKFKRSLLKMKRDKNYARFVVWPDSYEAYLAARTITDEASLPAGWQPMYEKSIFEHWSRLLCTPDKPKTPPKPKPNPDPNAPPKPKPLPEPPID